MEIGVALVLLVALLASCFAGSWFQGRLKDHHRSKDTIESVRLLVTMLVTFAALVLGLLVTSVKADFDRSNDIYRDYGVSLIRLDQKLKEYGPGTDTIRGYLKSYTAAAIAVTWPEERAPVEVGAIDAQQSPSNANETAALTNLLLQIDEAIQHLSPPDEYHRKLASILQDDIRRTETERWTLVESSHSKLGAVFLFVLMSWLVIIFLIVGITSPRNTLTASVAILSAISVASSLYLILDLDSPIGGLISVSSQPMRDALWHIDQPAAGP